MRRALLVVGLLVVALTLALVPGVMHDDVMHDDVVNAIMHDDIMHDDMVNVASVAAARATGWRTTVTVCRYGPAKVAGIIRRTSGKFASANYTLYVWTGGTVRHYRSGTTDGMYPNEWVSVSASWTSYAIPPKPACTLAVTTAPRARS